MIPEHGNQQTAMIWPIDDQGIERRWYYGSGRVLEDAKKGTVWAKRIRGEIQIHYHQDGKPKIRKSVWTGKLLDASTYGSELLNSLFGMSKADFSFPKSLYAVKDCLESMSYDGKAVFLDYFSGSGTTGHAVIDLNREDGGERKFILTEMGNYFDTVLKPRIQKVIYNSKWNNGKPVNHDTGISHCFKYIRLESYEDTLNNLELEDRQQDLLGLSDEIQQQYLVNYMLDIETRGSLLSFERFENPFDTTLKIYNRQTGKAEPKQIDLPETFNYLLGLRVREVKMRDGFLTIEGENPAGETVLVIWRNVIENENAALERFVTETLRINTADTEYHAIYINGDTTLNDPHKKILLTEEIFNNLMFDIKQL